MPLADNALLESSPFDASQLPSSVRRVLSLLGRLKVGTLELSTPEGAVLRYGSGQAPMSRITIKNWDALSNTLKSGDIGFAEAYMADLWRSDDLAGLLRLFIANRKGIEDVIYGHWLGRLSYRIKHLLNRNTRKNSKKNIHAHYDLGNSFYEIWLDASMNYSSALFEGNHNKPLQDAQLSKVARALRMVDMKPGARLLEIGCGWGALAQMASETFGAKVTGVTLSVEQLEFAQKRMKTCGQENSTDLRLEDYRDIKDAPFDAICSIEMFEAVGHEYWDSYFESISKLLKPGARACIQSIVIDESLFERYLHSTDFIQQYIFPGGCLPSASEFRKRAAQAGLEVVNELCFGPDYAETLRRWRSDFMSRVDEILSIGFDDRFVKLWEFYLAYCEAAFDESNIDVIQFTLRKVH
jgi:cyclopropane-fatty-acyl-phospholipid synthase